MSDIMEGDENMIVLVVGDEDSSKDDPLSNVKIDSVFSMNDKDPAQMPYPVTFKIEPLDGSTTHDTENINIKEEQDTDEYEVEYLDEFPLEGDGVAKDDKDTTYYDSDQDYKVQDDDDEDEDDHDESSDSEYRDTSRKKTTGKGRGRPRKTGQKKKKEPKKRLILNVHKREKLKEKVSYVQKLRDENPEMKEDEEKLIKQLAIIMRDTVPPTPPENYCTVITTDEGDKKKYKYKCTFCDDESATTEAAAARHYQFKHGTYYLNCYACGLAHKDTPSLYKHERVCRAPDAEIMLRARGLYLGRKGRSRPYFVNTKFVTKNTFVKQKGEVEERRYYCSTCTASYAHRENLRAHEYTHRGLRPHRCPHCPMSYASYAQYKRHMNLHGDYQYVCDHCGKKFRLRPALISHLETHQPRKHPCLHCDRRFADKTARDHHMNKVHLNQPAAQGCPVCPKRYAKMSHVKEHMSRKHGLTMMTAKMFSRAMPKLTDEEVERTRKLFELPTHTKIVKIIRKKNAKSDNCDNPENIYYHDSVDVGHNPGEESHDLEYTGQGLEDVSHDVEYIGPDLEDINHEPEKIDDEQEEYPVEYLEEIEELEEDQGEEKEELLEPRKKRTRRPKIASPIKIDEVIEDEAMYNIEYKRKKKTANPTTDIKKTNEQTYDILRNIKSTITERKKKITEAEKKISHFYEMKREFLDQLKNEIEIPKSKEKKPKNVVTEKQSQKIVPGTEIPEDLVPWTKTTETVTPQTIIAENDDNAKISKDVSEKNKVVLDFFKYVKTGVVLKHVPILRRGKETKEKIKF